MEDEEFVREADQVRRERLIGNDDNLDEIIARLMEQGLTYDEARDIALSDIEENNRRMRNYTMENKVAQLKAINDDKELRRKQDNELATNELKRKKDKKISELEKIVLETSRRFNSQQQKLINDALAYYKSYDNPMTITDEEYSSLDEELNKMKEIKRLKITSDMVDKLLSLFTTPIEEVEEYKYEETEYGGKRSRRRRKTRKTRRKRRRMTRRKRRNHK